MKSSTLIALLVFAALVAGVGYVTTRKPERGISRISFAQVDVASIDRVDLSGKSSISLHKDGDRWRNDKGKDADPDAVKALLDGIPKVQSTDFSTRAPERYADLEVDDAKGTHVVAKAGTRVVTDFIVGKQSGTRTPFRVGDAVYWVSQVGAWAFVKEASAWLDKKLIPDRLDQVARLEVRIHGQKPYALVKKENDWAFEDASAVPAGFRYDKGIASTLVSQLVNARAKDVLDADPGAATTRLDGESDTWVINVKDASGVEVKRELRLGAAQPDGNVYAQVTGREDVFVVPDFLSKAIRKAPTDLRDLTMMTIDLTKVEELTIAADKVKVVFEKKAGLWKVASASPPAPKGFEFDPSAVDRRLSALINSRGIKLAEVAPAEGGLVKPTATVVAKLTGKQSASLIFGKDTKDGAQELVYARGNADGATYLVTKWIKTNLTGGIETFKKQPPPSGAPGFDPGQLSNLPPEVRAQLMQQLAQRRQGTPPMIQANVPPPPKPAQK